MRDELFTPSISSYSHQDTSVSVDFKWNLEQQRLCSWVDHVLSWEERTSRLSFKILFSILWLVWNTQADLHATNLHILKSPIRKLKAVGYFLFQMHLWVIHCSPHRTWKTHKTEPTGICLTSPNWKAPDFLHIADRKYHVDDTGSKIPEKSRLQVNCVTSLSTELLPCMFHAVLTSAHRFFLHDQSRQPRHLIQRTGSLKCSL